MELHGGSILGAEVVKSGATTFRGVEAASGKQLEPAFHEASESEASRAMAIAEQAFAEYRSQPPEKIAEFLETIGTELEKLGPELIARASAETALPEARLLSERGRTIGQLRMFARLVREGSWIDARIDRADPARTPAPKPDLRRMLVPLGPVVVFGASNFPLAFSVCGGDTASALAAGNPVVVKGHPAHPGTSEMAARAVQQAVQICGLPAGVFSLLQGASPALSLTLVRHPSTRAVGFTGSLQAGRALLDAAATRPVPIPVFAEMGSVNPVFILSEALKARGTEIAQNLAKSVTLGVGQFCTKPGLIVGRRDDAFDSFLENFASSVSTTAPGTMLHAGIASHYTSAVSSRARSSQLRPAAPMTHPKSDAPKTQACGVVFVTEAQSFLEDKGLHQEVFGPASLAVVCNSADQLEKIARSLEGQLTVTIHGTSEDLRQHVALIDILREKAGRLLFGGVPTGVEVASAMQHGGPYPATTDSRFTSVGTAAILRFVRPLCFQDCPQDLLPPELKDENPRGIWRIVDNDWTKAAIKG